MKFAKFRNLWFFYLILVFLIINTSLLIYFFIFFKVEKYQNGFLFLNQNELSLQNVDWNILQNNEYKITYQINEQFYEDTILIKGYLDQKILIEAINTKQLMNDYNIKNLNISIFLEQKTIMEMIFQFL
ncbi:MAG1140 family protein [Mycoplasma buteonis]|uniref:MAG1140 family protein n=1 Tax=Mycoplasma buteonis TaxID=171280 RepID=UPI000569C8DC|nr:hypothetical protein [Mycoplasma buteonis]